MSSDRSKLIIIKAIHTAIWVMMASAACYVLYAGIFRIYGLILWTSIALLSFETVVLLINKWICPLTPIAMKYTGDRRANFDIYLPEKIAEYNKLIFGSIFGIGLLLVIINLIIQK